MFVDRIEGEADGHDETKSRNAPALIVLENLEMTFK